MLERELHYTNNIVPWEKHTKSVYTTHTIDHYDWTSFLFINFPFTKCELLIDTMNHPTWNEPLRTIQTTTGDFKKLLNKLRVNHFSGNKSGYTTMHKSKLVLTSYSNYYIFFSAMESERINNKTRTRAGRNWLACVTFS